MSIKFDWDPAKALYNVNEHKISFDEAKSVFGDPLARVFFDYDHSFDEKRHGIYGRTIAGRLILVIFTELTDDIIRIISAREMTPRERREYEYADGRKR
ncbi:BrnT family toxin [soil metagenome]